MDLSARLIKAVDDMAGTIKAETVRIVDAINGRSIILKKRDSLIIISRPHIVMVTVLANSITIRMDDGREWYTAITANPVSQQPLHAEQTETYNAMADALRNHGYPIPTFTPTVN